MEHDTTRHDTIIPNLSPLLIFILFFLLLSNCTRLISLRENLVQSHRFKSFSLWHTYEQQRTHIPDRSEKCTCDIYTEEDQHFSSLFHVLLKLESLPNEHGFCDCSMNFTFSRTISFTSLALKFASSQKLFYYWFYPRCVCVCLWVRLCVWATISDASMILTLEHYNNHVVRKTLPLFVHVSSHPAVDVRLGVCLCTGNYLVKAKIDGCLRWLTASTQTKYIFFLRSE